MGENMLPVSPPGVRNLGIERWFQPGSNVMVIEGAHVGTVVGVVVGTVVGAVVGIVVCGEVVGVMVKVGVGMIVVAVVTGEIVGVVVGIVVGTVVGVDVGVVLEKVSATFCDAPDWKYAVCGAWVVPPSQKVINTGPLAISSYVAYTLSLSSKGPGPPYDPGVATRISPAFLAPILARMREPAGTGRPDDVACP